MSKTNFMDSSAFEIFSKVFGDNLPDKLYETFLKMKNDILLLIQDYINDMINQEVDDFMKKFPDANNVRFYNAKRKTFLGEINFKYPMFRTQEFKSKVVQTKSIMLFLEMFGLIEFIRTASLSYSQIKNIFKAFGISISNQMIANISKAVNEVTLNEDNNLENVNEHQLVVFVDGRHSSYNEPEKCINHTTGEVFNRNKAKKIVQLTAIGIDENGVKQVLTSINAEHENSEAYSQLFNKLKYKYGINKIDVVTSDGTPALDDALLEFYPETKRQKCVVHYAREIKKDIIKRYKYKFNKWFISAHRLNNKNETINELEKIADWLKSVGSMNAYAKVKKIIKEQFTIAFYDLPETIWRNSYTNNISENLNSVFRRFSPSNTNFKDVNSLNRTTKFTKIHLNSIYKKHNLYL